MTYLIVLLAVLIRFIPHLPNFSPVFGALLFAGAYMRKRDSIWYPLALLAVSDVLLDRLVYHMRFGWYELLGSGAFVVVPLVGRWLRNRVKVQSVLAASLAGPTAFFIVSNFTVWLGWRMYAPTWQGLVVCYVAALPFFRNSLLASVLFSGVLFGGYELYRRKFAPGSLRGSLARTA
jgi:uncharacterized protein DUF6580